MMEVPPPELMARAIGGASQENRREGLRSFRASLLRLTLARAFERAPFWRERLRPGLGDDPSGALSKNDSLLLLRGVEPVDKEEIRKQLPKVLIDEANGVLLRATSGTSSRPFHVYHSSREYEYVEGVLTAMAESRRQRAGETSLKNTLTIFSMAHGLPPPRPRGGVHLATGATEWRAEWFHTYLNAREAPFAALAGVDPYLRVLVCGVKNLLALTQLLLETGFVFAETSIEELVTNSHYLTQTARDFLEGVWKKPLRDRFSLTEIVGGANSCPMCRHYHFDPYVLPEVVDLETERPLDKGVGQLLLTSLYPFSQMQPMLRYRTGDLFRVDPEACPLDVAYAPLGRIKRSICREGKVLLTEADVLEVLEARHDLAVVPLSAFPERQDRELFGTPKYVLEKPGDTKVVLTVELRRAESQAPEVRKAVGGEIIAALLARRPGFDDGVHSLEVEVLPPGGFPLATAFVLK